MRKKGLKHLCTYGGKIEIEKRSENKNVKNSIN